MTRLTRLAPLCLVLAVALSPSCASADALQRLHEFVRDTRTLSGSFTQTVYDRKGQKTQDAEGRFDFSRPGKFRWVYETPYRQLIVSDGRTVWLYDEDLEQVTIRKMGKAIGESPAALLAGSGQIDRFFSLKDAAPADGLEWLDATPRTQGGTFEWVRLGFQGNTLKAMELKDNFGQKTILKFGGLDENPRLKPELFEFTPPKGVDVMREQ